VAVVGNIVEEIINDYKVKVEVLILCAAEAYSKRGPCANTKTSIRVSAVVLIQLCILIKPPQWAVNVLPMMQTLLSLINILFQSIRKPKFHHLSPSHCPISTPFLLTLRTPIARQIYHYTLILPILLHYLGLYRRTTYLKSLPHI
jgi:hypothetical protein